MCLTFGQPHQTFLKFGRMNSRAIDINCQYLGIPRLLLMENAGKGIAEIAKDFNRIAVFCGTGNNGGDGLVAARYLVGYGKKVKTYVINGKRTTECEKNFDILKNLDSVDIRIISDSVECNEIKDELKDFDLIIDALVGVGIKGSLREPLKSVIELINSSKPFKISVDVPSGDENLKVNPDITVSLHTAKVPNAKVIDIGIPKEAELYCGPGDVVLAIPDRKENSHKGDFGKLLVIGGSKNYIGTPTLVGRAALRTGVDLVTICCPRYVAEKMPYDPNLIIRSLKSDLYLKEDDVDNILELDYDVIAIGNGLGTEDETKEAVREIIGKNEKPIVIDADALKLIKTKHIKENSILTPHAGEFKILFGSYDEKSRVELVEKLASEINAVIVLKGHVDVISNGKTTRLNRTGNPGMTVGGTGDTLAGIISGLLAQNRDTLLSASAGTFLNGFAGDLAYEKYGISLLATDLIECIPDAIKKCEDYK